MECALKLDFPITNNEAEYEALIVGLGLAKALGVKCLQIYGDSKLVVLQINRQYEAMAES